MWSNRTSAPGRDVPADQPAPRDINLPAPPAQPSPTPQGRTTGAPSGGAAQPDLAVRRGGERKVDGKTFRLVAGAWIDASFDPLAALPTRDVVGAEARASLLASDPVLAKYAALGPRVLVVHEKVVYRFQP
jgi:hypothetical protein